MKLSFFGAARAVTGSCHCLEVCGKRILIDCGLQQGRDEIDNAVLPFSAGDIDMVIVTHAHIDHSGRLPLLVKQGFSGKIITTRLTAQLLSIMLRDSAHIQESDAAWENQKGKRAGRAPVEPIYTLIDAQNTIALIETYDYNTTQELAPGISLRFTDAGHLLGSALTELWLSENGENRKIVFSGDLGNINQPIIRNPQMVKEADYVVTESTYGDRTHEGEGEYTDALAEILDKTFARGGNVIIPSFAVGRTQELLYFIREIKQRVLVKSLPSFPVFVDSPLAKEATRIFSGDLTGYIDEEAKELVSDGISMLSFPELHLCETSDESKALNLDPSPKVIISASGMCDAGRIRHHLKHNLWRAECSVVFVGFQAIGSFGRRLLDGVSPVKLFGEEISINADIINFRGLSSHADHDELIRWAQGFDPIPKQFFVVHGDAEVAPRYAKELTELGLPAHAPEFTEEYDLLANKLISAGVPAPERKTAPAENPRYAALLESANHLMELVRGAKGTPNKDLKHLNEQLAAIIQKLDK